jgi:adenine-specific DNA-methyltransferase
MTHYNRMCRPLAPVGFFLAFHLRSCFNNAFLVNLPCPMINQELGAVYTPEILASWAASELLKHLPNKKSAWIVDPACGDGALLRSVQTVGKGFYRLIGVDINPAAIEAARLKLGAEALLKCADALQPSKSADVEKGWKELLGPDISAVICNPPWGARLSHSAEDLRAKGYALAKGQYDSFDLFIELCLRVVPKGAVLVFIIPDALFFPEHKPLRSLLLEQTQLHLIARLGEGFFEDVYRGTTVLVCEKRSPDLLKQVECFRLRKSSRQEILANRAILAATKKEEAHWVPQRRFQQDPEKRFDIDVLERDLEVFSKMHQFRGDWVTWLESGRGVELSKTGLVVICPKCKTARPQPREETDVRCLSCGKGFNVARAISKTIVRTAKAALPGWKPLIVGEDVKRYLCHSSRMIEANVPGINYKDAETFSGRKLLVRKTGVGINAAIDESGAFTNQVVFHYRSRQSTPSFFLDYVLGVLCSRVMLAYHLKRTGESEWRSHPYMTQKTIGELPVPKVTDGTWRWKQAWTIANTVKQRRAGDSIDAGLDLRIDSLVAGLFGLTRKDCDWVLNVLNEAQPLEAISRMRLDIGLLHPARA